MAKYLIMTLELELQKLSCKDKTSVINKHYEKNSLIYQWLTYKCNRKNYIDFCKKNCDILLKKYKNVIWEGFEKNERDKAEQNGINLNDSSIREQEIRENHIPRIKELWSKDEIDGYNCSPCDSFLLFLCCYFEINIHYKSKNWNNQPIHVTYLYNHPEKGYNNNKALFFSTSKSHFSYVSYVK